MLYEFLFVFLFILSPLPVVLQDQYVLCSNGTHTYHNPHPSSFFLMENIQMKVIVFDADNPVKSWKLFYFDSILLLTGAVGLLCFYCFHGLT